MIKNGIIRMTETTDNDHATVDDTITLEKNVDFVLVWNSNDEDCNSEKAVAKRKIFEANLEKEGLVLNRKFIKSQGLLFVQISASLEVLKRYAEILKIRLPIKELPENFTLQDKPTSRLVVKASSCMHALFGYDKRIFPDLERKITTPYIRGKHYLFDINENNFNTIFTSAIRSRIVHYILKRNKYKNEGDSTLDFGYERLLTANVYSAAYPLHDGELSSVNCQRGLLLKYWGSLNTCLNYQPLDAVKDYFGVQISIYFAWLGFYTRMLIFPALLGLICFIYGCVTLNYDEYTQDVCNSDIKMCPLCDKLCDYWDLKSLCWHSKLTYLFDNDATAIFSLSVSIWTAVYLEFWMRYNNELTYRWDLTGFGENDQMPRPEYIARLKHSKTKQFNYVTNTEEPSAPFWTMKLPFKLVSYSTVLLLICVALAAVFGVICYRTAVLMAFEKQANENPDINNYALLIVNVTAASINLLFILGFSWVYRHLAQYLTEMEIPRTQEEYDWSYALKLYILQFINHYSSIFYIAYIKGNFIGAPHKYVKIFGQWRQEECGVSCMAELCIQLAVIMIGKQARNAIFEIIIPYLRKVCKLIRLRATGIADEKVDVMKNRMLKDYLLLNWENDGLTEEYLEMVIQYGFVTIFVAAFPLAPLFALLNNMIEVRIDAMKFLKYYRRPIALRVTGIGVWYTIMDFLAKFSVLSNAVIIAITSNFIPKLLYRLFYFDTSNSNFGTLRGFLNHTLCGFNVTDIVIPDQKFRDTDTVSVCRFPAYRHDYNADASDKYKYTEFYWQVWVARGLFIIAFENIVAVIILFIRWAIPDIPSRVKQEIQRNEFITNELIIQQELLRAPRCVIKFDADESQLSSTSERATEVDLTDTAGD